MIDPLLIDVSEVLNAVEYLLRAVLNLTLGLIIGVVAAYLLISFAWTKDEE